MESDERNFTLHVANVATATTCVAYYAEQHQILFAGDSRSDPVERTFSPVTNFQLAFWKDAKVKFARIREIAFPDPADLVLVIASLGFSLTFLFGVNYTRSTGDNETPNLVGLVGRWKLKKSNPDLFRRFEELHTFFSQNVRHTDAHKIQSEILPLSKAKVQSFMKTTQDLWKWFIQTYCEKHGQGIVPEDQLVEFSENY